MARLDALPPDLLVHVLQRVVCTATLLACDVTCSALRDAARDDRAWEKLNDVTLPKARAARAVVEKALASPGRMAVLWRLAMRRIIREQKNSSVILEELPDWSSWAHAVLHGAVARAGPAGVVAPQVEATLSTEDHAKLEQFLPRVQLSPSTLKALAATVEDTAISLLESAMLLAVHRHCAAEEPSGADRDGWATGTSGRARSGQRDSLLSGGLGHLGGLRPGYAASGPECVLPIEAQVVGENDLMLAFTIKGFRWTNVSAIPLYVYGANPERDDALRKLGRRAGVPRMTARAFERLGSMLHQHMAVLLFQSLLRVWHSEEMKGEDASDGESTLTETDDDGCSWSGEDLESDDSSESVDVDDPHVRIPSSAINAADGRKLLQATAAVRDTVFGAHGVRADTPPDPADGLE